MSKQRKGIWWRTLVLLVALFMVAAACGDDDDTTASDDTASDDTASDDAASDDSASDDSSDGSSDGAAADDSADDSSTDGDMDRVLTIAISTEPSTLDGQVVNDRAARVVTGNIFESLIFRDRTAQLVPGLALSWQSLDEENWEFTLREGVTFHDDSPFNAASAAYSINRMVAEDFETQRSSYIRGIVSAEATGDYTVVVTTDGPDAVLPLQMAQVPMVPLDAGDEMNDEPVGTGPYQFSDWNRGQSITAARYDGYWGDPATIPEFTVRVIPDAQTALAALQKGEVDLVLDVLPDQVSAAPKAVNVPATEFSYIAFNTFVEEMSDPRVRVAMNLAVDKELIAETIYSGFGRPNHAQHVTPESLGFNPDITAFPYDPDQARTLLAEAGYPDGFEVTMNVPIGRYLFGEETARFVAQQLEDIGLTVDIVEWEWNEYRSAGRVKPGEDGALDLKYGWNSNEWFDSARVASHVTCGGSSSKICDQLVSDNFEIGATSVDQEERDQAYQAAWAQLHENPHAIYLLQQDLIYGMSEDLVWDPRLDDEYYVREMSFG